MVKEKGKLLLEEEADVVSKVKGQGMHEEVPRPRVVEHYRPPVPFPQRLTKAKFAKVLEVLKKLQISIPFLDAISEMSSNSPMLNSLRIFFLEVKASRVSYGFP